MPSEHRAGLERSIPRPLVSIIRCGNLKRGRQAPKEDRPEMPQFAQDLKLRQAGLRIRVATPFCREFTVRASGRDELSIFLFNVRSNAALSLIRGVGLACNRDTWKTSVAVRPGFMMPPYGRGFESHFEMVRRVFCQAVWYRRLFRPFGPALDISSPTFDRLPVRVSVFRRHYVQRMVWRLRSWIDGSSNVVDRGDVLFRPSFLFNVNRSRIQKLCSRFRTVRYCDRNGELVS